MIKYVPVITTDPNGRLNMAFDVTLVDIVASSDTIHSTYGGGTCFTGKEIGKASVVLGRGSNIITKNELKVLFLSGYRKDGKDFSVELEKGIIEACKTAAKAFWG